MSAPSPAAAPAKAGESVAPAAEEQRVEASSSGGSGRERASPGPPQRPPPPRRPSRVPHGQPAGERCASEEAQPEVATGQHSATPPLEPGGRPAEEVCTPQAKAAASGLLPLSAHTDRSSRSRGGAGGGGGSTRERPWASPPASMTQRSRLSSSRSKAEAALDETLHAQEQIARYIQRVQSIRSEVADVHAYCDVLDTAIEALEARRGQVGGKDAVLAAERKLSKQADLLEQRILQSKEAFMKAKAANKALRDKVDTRRREKLSLRRAVERLTSEGNALAAQNAQMEDDIQSLVAARREVESQVDGAQEESRLELAALEAEYEALGAAEAAGVADIAQREAALQGLVGATEAAAEREAAALEALKSRNGDRKAAAAATMQSRTLALPGLAGQSKTPAQGKGHRSSSSSRSGASSVSRGGFGAGPGRTGPGKRERKRAAVGRLSAGLLDVGAIEKGNLHTADGTLFFGGKDKGDYNVSKAMGAASQARAGSVEAAEATGPPGGSSPGGRGSPATTSGRASPIRMLGSGRDGSVFTESLVESGGALSPTPVPASLVAAAPPRHPPVTPLQPPRGGGGGAPPPVAVPPAQDLPVQRNWSEVWAVLSAMTGFEAPAAFAARYQEANDLNYDLYLRVDTLAKEADEVRQAVMRCQHELNASTLADAVAGTEQTLGMADVEAQLRGILYRRAALREALENSHACESVLEDALERMLGALDFSNVGRAPTSTASARRARLGGMSAGKAGGGVRGSGGPSSSVPSASTGGGGRSSTGQASAAAAAASLSTGQRLVRQHRLLEQRLRQVLVIFKQSGGDIVLALRQGAASGVPPTPPQGRSRSGTLGSLPATPSTTVVEALRVAGGVAGEAGRAVGGGVVGGAGPGGGEEDEREGASAPGTLSVKARRRSVDMSVIDIRRGMLAGANDAYASDDSDTSSEEGGEGGGQPTLSPMSRPAFHAGAASRPGPASGKAASVGSSRSGGLGSSTRRRKRGLAPLDERAMILGPDTPGLGGVPSAPLLRALPPSTMDGGAELLAAEAALRGLRASAEGLPHGLHA